MKLNCELFRKILRCRQSFHSSTLWIAPWQKWQTFPRAPCCRGSARSLFRLLALSHQQLKHEQCLKILLNRSIGLKLDLLQQVPPLQVLIFKKCVRKSSIFIPGDVCALLWMDIIRTVGEVQYIEGLLSVSWRILLHSRIFRAVWRDTVSSEEGYH